MDRRMGAIILGAGRGAFGLALMVVPRAIGRPWIGPAADTPGGIVALRAVGARDLVLGVGLLMAVRRGASVRGWVEAGIAADLADATTTLAAFRELPAPGRLVTLATAGGAAATGLAIARSLPARPAD